MGRSWSRQQLVSHLRSHGGPWERERPSHILSGGSPDESHDDRSRRMHRARVALVLSLRTLPCEGDRQPTPELSMR